jgi:hypothetical protein
MTDAAKLNSAQKGTSRHSQKPNGDWLLEQLTILAEAMGESLTPSRLEIYLTDLADLSREQLEMACWRARRELRFFPKIAELREFAGALSSAVDDRPDPELAWAMCPQGEEKSVVWTDEMAEAFGLARPLLSSGDAIAARMVFKEQYPRLLAKVRARGEPVRWTASLGWDPKDRMRALADAMEKKRITVEHALTLISPMQRDELMASLPATERKLLAGEVKPCPKQLNGLQAILLKVTENKLMTIPERSKRFELTDEQRREHTTQVRQQAAEVRLRTAKQQSGKSSLLPKQASPRLVAKN